VPLRWRVHPVRAAVVAERDCFGERYVESERAGNAGRDLGDFECVGEARAHVVVGENEHLCLARETTERARVQDSVAITLKASAIFVGLFVEGPLSGSVTPRRTGRHELVQDLLAPSERAASASTSGAMSPTVALESRCATVTSALAS